MKRELEDKLKEEFPKIFRDMHDSSPMESCMSFGIECSDGWYDLIYNLCKSIVEAGAPEEFKAEQVKEKFGGLRFYVTHSTPEINKLIDAAETRSYEVCESCGSTTNVDTKGRPHWVSTLCEGCDNQ